MVGCAWNRPDPRTPSAVGILSWGSLLRGGSLGLQRGRVPGVPRWSRPGERLVGVPGRLLRSVPCCRLEISTGVSWRSRGAHALLPTENPYWGALRMGSFQGRSRRVRGGTRLEPGPDSRAPSGQPGGELCGSAVLSGGGAILVRGVRGGMRLEPGPIHVPRALESPRRAHVRGLCGTE